MMAGEPLSDQPPAQAPGADTDFYYIVQAGETRQQTRAQLRTGILTAWQAFMGTFLASADQATARSNIGAEKVGLGATPGYIDGLNVVWNSANSVSVTTGAAYIQSLTQVLNVPATITKGSLVLTATTWYHVYLFSNAGVADIEIVTTAPSAKVYGNARTKTGDPSRRYLRSIRTAAANTIIRDTQNGNSVRWLADTTATPFNVLTSGVATTATNVSCSACIPTTGTHAAVQLITGAIGAVGLFIANPDAGTVSATFSQTSLGASSASSLEISISSAQAFSYVFSGSPGAGSASARIYGYLFER